MTHIRDDLLHVQAYRKWVSQNGEEPPLPGIQLSHDQLFFLNYAQVTGGPHQLRALLTISGLIRGKGVELLRC